MTSSTWQTIKFECFLGFGMWSVPPYCETKDLMNRIRKIHFKRHNSNIEDEEFDNYMTIWKVPCYFFWLEIQFLCCGHEKNKGFQGIKYDEYRTFINFFAFKSFKSILSSFLSGKLVIVLKYFLLGYALLQQWICLESTQLTKVHRWYLKNSL
jgi:hypothetical protein